LTDIVLISLATTRAKLLLQPFRAEALREVVATDVLPALGITAQ
jgi:hypothetical protein